MLGDKVISLGMIPRLQFLDACIKETLRLNSPIGLFTLGAKRDTYVGNGKYKINKNDAIRVNLKGLHHDYLVWGENHNEFCPERFMNGEFQKLPPNSWKPYGNGLRACIGRGFAEQEMLIASAMILQKFNPEMVDPSYNLQLKSTLTVKPEGFQMKVARRPGKSPLVGIPGGEGAETTQDPKSTEKISTSAVPTTPPHSSRVNIFFGGNAGTCEGFAQILENRLMRSGFHATVSSLDAAAESLDNEALSLFITSSYEGKPPDNGKRFVTWLERLVNQSDAFDLKGIRYAMMGVGNSDWTGTFHRIPRFIDDSLESLGAQRMIASGYANVKTDLMGPFEDWTDALLEYVTGSEARNGNRDTLTLKIEEIGPIERREEMSTNTGTVSVNRELANASVGFAKKHMEIHLPDDVTYAAGDYLVVQPENPARMVHRVMQYFGFTTRTSVCVEGSTKTYLPKIPTSMELFLRTAVELSTPVTKRQLKIIAEHAEGEAKSKLNELQQECAYASTLAKRFSVMDILEDHKPFSLPSNVYLDMLVPLVPRQYSISSSPLLLGNEGVVSITYDVHTGDSFSGHGRFEGVASTYLAARVPVDRINCSVRSTNVGFRLPADPATPIIMFAAGTGIAPMRAFLQERAAILEAKSRKLGPALLFYGCRHPDKDFLYKQELEHWQSSGIVQIFPAYSRAAPEDSAAPRYVHDAIWEQRQKCSELFDQGGRVYLCGSAAKLGQSCADVWKRIFREGNEKSEAEAEKWLESVRKDRYISDTY